MYVYINSLCMRIASNSVYILLLRWLKDGSTTRIRSVCILIFKPFADDYTTARSCGSVSRVFGWSDGFWVNAQQRAFWCSLPRSNFMWSSAIKVRAAALRFPSA